MVKSCWGNPLVADFIQHKKSRAESLKFLP